MIKHNVILDSDSYKVGHWIGYPDKLEAVYSYFEARRGSKYNETVFFGLQYLLNQIEGVVITKDMIDDAERKFKAHFFGAPFFNRADWEYILTEHGGKLPVRIQAVDEGSVIPINNVVMTIENTGGPRTAWLVNYLETFLSRIWYPITVATKSYNVKKIIKRYLDETAEHDQLLPFLLHDFGARGVSSAESAGIGGAAHLVNFLGTDTIVAMECVADNYDMSYEDGIGHSVFATEHSMMTALGPNGELDVIRKILDANPVGIVSVVADSYDYYRNVSQYVGKDLKEQILKRHAESNGVPTKYVVRPDSITPDHPTPEDLVVWTYNQLERDFGVTINSKGYKELNPAAGVIWGDGIDMDGTEKILESLKVNKYATTTFVTGMGGGLLQKLNRDTARHAFKCSAQKQNGVWVDIQKNPLDQSKKSKAGRLALVSEDFNGVPFIKTIREDELSGRENLLKTVFENGEIVRRHNFVDIRKRAKL